MIVNIYRRKVGYTVFAEEAMWRTRFWRPTLRWARWTGRCQKGDPEERGAWLERL